jgi:hypothetical protein
MLNLLWDAHHLFLLPKKIEKKILNPFFPLLLVHYDHPSFTLFSGVWKYHFHNAVVPWPLKHKLYIYIYILLFLMPRFSNNFFLKMKTFEKEKRLIFWNILLFKLIIQQTCVPKPPRYYSVFKLGSCVGQGTKGGGPILNEGEKE